MQISSRFTAQEFMVFRIVSSINLTRNGTVKQARCNVIRVRLRLGPKMRTFVTGGSGFIGGHLVKKLVHRGWQVRALARSDESAEGIAALGAKVIRGDVFDSQAMLEGMQGCDVVFHVAGVYSTDVRKQDQLIPVNVHGTESVLRAAMRAGVERIIYASSIVVLGHTHGQVVDETYYYRPPWRTKYERSKWLAHHRVVEPLMQKGAPIIITMPGAVYGPGDHSVVGELFELLYKGVMRIFPGRDTIISFVHVEDVAEGLILAAEKGKIGESYLLSGENASLMQAAEWLSELLGRRVVDVYLPGRVVHPLIPIVGWLTHRFPMPVFMHPDSLRLLGATYIASNAKAKSELGWSPRSLREGLPDVISALKNGMK